MLRGQQPDMLLLGRTHFEAMLSGLLSPDDLFTELVDQASYRSEVYVALEDLVAPPDSAPPPALVLGSPPDQRVPVVTETAPGVQAEVIIYSTQAFDKTVDGVAVDLNERLLLTVPAGIARIDLGTGVVEWAVPIPGCRRSALPLAERKHPRSAWACRLALASEHG